ncbi:MAG: alpha/beta hydrolase [Bacteroidota bacterium]|nr:alpha/beta hydrolase [Bacteroidota bacterium]
MIFKKVIKRKRTTERKPDPENPVSVMISSDLSFGQQWLKRKGVRRLVLNTHDGLKLHGYFVPSLRPTKKLVILVHGFGTDARMMAKYGMMYQQMDYDIFLADSRAHGDSEGKYVGMGWLDRIDYLQWTDFLLNDLGTERQIIFHGVSMGGATVLMMSGEQLPPQVKAIISDSAYTSASDQISYLIKSLFHLPTFPLLNLAEAKTKRKAGYGLREAIAIRQVRKSITPILFIHGGADLYTPTNMAHQLFDSTICPKKLLIVPGAKHAMSYNDAPEIYEATIRNFIDQYISN